MSLFNAASSTFSNRPDPNGDDHAFEGSSGTVPTGAQESEPRSSLPDTEESPSTVEEVHEMWLNSQWVQRETHSDSDNPADSGTPKFWHSTPNSEQSTGEKESNPIKLQPTPSATTTITPAEHDADDSDKDADADDLDDMFLAELDNDDHGEEAEEDQSTLNMSEDDCGDGSDEMGCDQSKMTDFEQGFGLWGESVRTGWVIEKGEHMADLRQGPTYDHTSGMKDMQDSNRSVMPLGEIFSGIPSFQ